MHRDGERQRSQTELRWVVREGRPVRGRKRHSHKETQQEVGAKDKDNPKQTESELELAERKDRVVSLGSAGPNPRARAGAEPGLREAEGAPLPSRRRALAARRDRPPGLRPGRAGGGRAGARAGGGGGAGAGRPPAAREPRDRSYKPAGDLAGAALRPAPLRPRSQSTDPASLAPGQTFAYEL